MRMGAAIPLINKFIENYLYNLCTMRMEKQAMGNIATWTPSLEK